MFNSIDKILRKSTCVLIRAYQYTLSPDHGIMSVFVVGQCRFRPTCSQFAYEQVRRHGAIKALPSIASRIFHCR